MCLRLIWIAMEENNNKTYTMEELEAMGLNREGAMKIIMPQSLLPHFSGK